MVDLLHIYYHYYINPEKPQYKNKNFKYQFYKVMNFSVRINSTFQINFTADLK